MTVSKSQCHYTEHFGRRKNKDGFLKINQWCKKKKGKTSKIVLQNSQAHQLIDSQRHLLNLIKDFHVDGSKLTVLGQDVASESLLSSDCVEEGLSFHQAKYEIACKTCN